MKFAMTIALILTSGLASGQHAKDPGLRYPQHATAPEGYKSSSSGPVAGRPRTNSTASDLARIEQKSTKFRARRTTAPNSAAPPAPAAQDRNKPMRFAPKPRARNAVATNLANSGRAVKVH
jgi:hypothetical protein